MKITADKLIITFSLLCLFNVGIIGGVLIGNKSQTGNSNAIYPVYSDLAVHPPKTGFSELIAQEQARTQVLSATTEATPTPKPSRTPQKKSYLIAIIGDSMAETMGDSLDYVKKDLKKKYPRTEFVMYNYGIGSENVSSGLERFDKPFDHGTRHYGSLPELKPDILIVGSYAYNPLEPFDRDKYANELAELVNKARGVSGKVYLLAEIAPVESGFGTGPGGVNWPANLAFLQVQKITTQMEQVFIVGKRLSVPVIDVYTQSQKPGTPYGKSEYVSTHDHIHPSLEGQTLTADVITNSIEF